MEKRRMIRIGCGSGFWGDSEAGPIQLVERAEIDYLVFDYLAEITMSLLARARQKDPAAGYVSDFVTGVMRRLLPDLSRKGIKVVANAGGVNPETCRRALEDVARELGISVKVAVVLGDDVSDMLDKLRESETREMFDGREMPANAISANAYLGAAGIAAALDAGAQIVITGRCVDSAIVLGPLIHEFGWKFDDYDRLSAGTLLGHLVECGCQVTGGVFTDWELVPGLDDVGFPVIECLPDGSGVLTKPRDTGGLVNCATVAEQMLYEIGDPRSYICPDVICDWTNVILEDDGTNRVRISGAKGIAATPTYKVSMTYQDGWRATTSLVFAGGDAGEKARRSAQAIIERSNRLCRERDLAVFSETSIEIIGTGEMSGRPEGRTSEVMLKMAVRHPSRLGVDVFCREVMPALTAMTPGIAGYFAGRPKPVPVVRLFSVLIPKSSVPVFYDLEDCRIAVEVAEGRPCDGPPAERTSAHGWQDSDGQATISVPLRKLAYARSGDKGDIANIGVIARNEAAHSILSDHLTAERVVGFLRHYVKGPGRRYDVPGIGAFNFVLEEALGGGGIASLRIDPQGKCFAPLLLEMKLDIPLEKAQHAGVS